MHLSQPTDGYSQHPGPPQHLDLNIQAGQKDEAVALKGWASPQGNPATGPEGGAEVGGALKGAGCRRKTSWALAAAGRSGELGLE